MLRDLFNEGLSISEIARQTGCDRKTIRKYINSETPPMRKEQPRKSGKLDPFKEYMLSRLNEHPFSAMRLYREIQDQGFTGKYGIVKNFVRKARPKIEVPAVYRYETKPGVQGQVDWAECGKIESTVKFVKKDFFMGGKFSSFTDLNLQLQQWLSRVNSSIHGTTHEVPAERLKLEEFNKINEVRAYIVTKEESRKISSDSHLSYLGNKYSVPYKFAGRTARLQIRDTAFSVFVGNELVCRHEILPGHGKVSRNKDHFKGLLSEILKQNSASRSRGENIVHFRDDDVEKRSLSVYESFCREA